MWPLNGLRQTEAQPIFSQDRRHSSSAPSGWTFSHKSLSGLRIKNNNINTLLWYIFPFLFMCGLQPYLSSALKQPWWWRYHSNADFKPAGCTCSHWVIHTLFPHLSRIINPFTLSLIDVYFNFLLATSLSHTLTRSLRLSDAAACLVVAALNSPVTDSETKRGRFA